MLSIGEFSRIGNITSKALRYYDEIGLLSPYFVDSNNNYRYYHVTQLRHLLLINKLKSYDFSLEEIKAILMDPTELLDLLSTKEEVLKNKAIHLEIIRENIEKDILRIKKGEDIMSNLNEMQVQLVDRKAINVVTVREKINIKDYGTLMASLFNKITKLYFTPLGPPMAIYYDLEFNPEESDIELMIEVAEKNVESKEFPAYKTAMISHKGDYSSLPEAYTKIQEFIVAENLQIIAPPFEIYLTDPETTEARDNIVEIHFPIGKSF